MEKMQQNFRDRLWDVFWDEAREKLDEMETALTMLVPGSSHQDAAVTIGRAGHTLRGNAGAMGLSSIAGLAGRVELVAATIGKDAPMQNVRAVQWLTKAVEVLAAFVASQDPENTDECANAIHELDTWLGAQAG